MKPLTEEEMLWMFEIILKGDGSMKKYKVSFFNVETQRDETQLVDADSKQEAKDNLEKYFRSLDTFAEVFKVEEIGFELIPEEG